MTLSREQILAMPAGVSLDELVAQHVIGMVPCALWRQMNFGSAGGPAMMKECDHDDGECFPVVAVASAFGQVGGCPRFSTSIAHAWEVVEKMQAPGENRTCLSLSYQSGVNLEDFDKFFYVVKFRAFPSNEECAAETAPLAICRAALLSQLKDAEVRK